MKLPDAPLLHRWDLSPGEAVRLQRDLARTAEPMLELGQVRLVAGTDVSYLPDSGESIGVVAVVEFPGLRCVDHASARCSTPFPYVPGLLSFREVPVLLEAFACLRTEPDLILVDGHGRAHPRRFGIACHLGTWLQRPTIGVGKSLLCGTCEEPDPEKGALTPLVAGGEVIGKAVRTRTGVKAVYVSAGFGVSLDDTVAWVLATVGRFRLPEPIRLADRLAANLKKG